MQKLNRTRQEYILTKYRQRQSKKGDEIGKLKLSWVQQGSTSHSGLSGNAGIGIYTVRTTVSKFLFVFSIFKLFL